MSRDMFGCHNGGVTIGIWWVEAWDAAENPTMQEWPPHQGTV